MASGRVVAAVLSGLSLGACALPTPDYKTVPVPPSYRREADGAALDNEGITLDPDGYRVDRKGRRIDVVDVPAKTAGEASNAVAGYYISSQGRKAPGSVMSPSEGGGSGAGYGPGSAGTQMPTGPTPASATTSAPAPAATGQPTPLGTAPPLK